MTTPDLPARDTLASRSVVEREAMLLARRVNRRLKAIREQSTGRAPSCANTVADAPATGVETPIGVMLPDSAWVRESATRT